MKTIFLILNWGFGGLLLLMGLWTISSTPFNMISVNLGGLCLLAIAFLLLPPVRKFLEGKTGKSLSIKSRAVTIFILLIVAVFGTHEHYFNIIFSSSLNSFGFNIFTNLLQIFTPSL